VSLSFVKDLPPVDPIPAPQPRLGVVVVAEVCLYREGLAQSLGHRPEVEVLGTASSRDEALELVCRARPDVVLLDMATPGAADVARGAHQALACVKVVALAIHETEEVVLACAAAGLEGYVSRSASLDDLVGTLQAVARGELVCPPCIAGSLFRQVAALSAARGGAGHAALTPRERQIAALIDEGMSNKEISRRLRIGLSTVKNHVHNLLEKLGVSRRGAAAARLRDHAGAGTAG
jgi:DNA-binding NarL/FixJ family response regulator